MKAFRLMMIIATFQILPGLVIAQSITLTLVQEKGTYNYVLKSNHAWKNDPGYPGILTALRAHSDLIKPDSVQLNKNGDIEFTQNSLRPSGSFLSDCEVEQTVRITIFKVFECREVTWKGVFDPCGWRDSSKGKKMPLFCPLPPSQPKNREEKKNQPPRHEYIHKVPGAYTALGTSFCRINLTRFP